VSVQPADGSVLTQAPPTVQLRFNEPVTAGAVRLIDAQGRMREDAAVSASGESIVVAYQPVWLEEAALSAIA
jgi:copper transport protein